MNGARIHWTGLYGMHSCFGVWRMPNSVSTVWPMNTRNRLRTRIARQVPLRARRALCVVLMAVCALSTGCASISWRTPDGGSATVRRFLWEGGFNRLYLKTDTTTIYVYGYNGQTDDATAKAIAEGIISGAK